MKPLAEIAKSPALLWLERSHDMERELRKAWTAKIARPTTALMLRLLNMGDSPRDLDRFRRHIPPITDISRETNDNLLALRNELRDLWKEIEKERGPSGITGTYGDNETVAVILSRLWHHYDLDGPGYMVFWTTGSFFPTQQNFRGIIARILFEKRRSLALCSLCDQYFIKKRDDQKICLGLSCKRKANRQRQSKHQAKKRTGRRPRGRI